MFATIAGFILIGSFLVSTAPVLLGLYGVYLVLKILFTGGNKKAPRTVSPSGRWIILRIAGRHDNTGKK